MWLEENGSCGRRSLPSSGEREAHVVQYPVTTDATINEKNWLRETNSQSKAAMESAVAAGNDEDEDEGEAMECGCCYCEVTFERMVQCSLGHLFCEECLRRYAKEAVYGQGKVALWCMGDGCSAGFPLSQLRKALPQMLMEKYEERQVEESISLAGLADLCSKLVTSLQSSAEAIAKFSCVPRSVDCMMESCRHCGEDWDEHFGKRCEELERCDETRLRTHYEERMTKLKVRTCGKCSAQFFKVEGCNKMTCRCGATMCYICRAPKISYQHFCQHAREPGKPCTSCTACSLWTNPDEDEDRAIRELKAEAQETRAAQGFVQDKEFGPPPEATQT
ncbi:PREDICTED: E3 ubiquitin-protein ligase RNF216-like, partial [Priapulus caudatus]|uniref:E3 ubiquitin-protein ligase RNF216-like n=1 Tax=Priapulus caudatus TaxID=37621 RepID=A0ABM1F116_PRICU